MEFFEGLIKSFRRKEVLRSVTVKPLDRKRFQRVVDSNQNGLVEIEMNHWQETSGREPIYNHGAGPCVIVFAWNRETGHILSGHFPEVLKSRQDYFTREAIEQTQNWYPKVDLAQDNQIEVPTGRAVDNLSYIRKDESYELFNTLQTRVHDWVKEVGGTNVEIFLFGQNGLVFGKTREEYAKRIVESAIEQNDVTFIFNRLGIAGAEIHDHRVPDQDKVDDTFFSPRDQVIYHSIRDHDENYMGWMQ